MIGMPYSRSISWPTATSRAADRQILSYDLRAAVSRLESAQPRNEMPIVIVRMSRFSICTMRMVSRISSGENWMAMRRDALNTMHELEHVLVLRVDLEAQLLALGVEPALQLVERHGRAREIGHHDHREEFAQRRLRDVDDVRVRGGQHGRDLSDDADGVDADDGHDDAIRFGRHWPYTNLRATIELPLACRGCGVFPSGCPRHRGADGAVRDDSTRTAHGRELARRARRPRA